MHSVKCEGSFDAAHFLSNYEGKCRNIHGHRWRIVIGVKGKLHNGMVVDFSVLKASINNLCEYFDHTFIVEKESLKKEIMEMLKDTFLLREVNFRTTAENFAKYFFDKINEEYECLYAEVYETPNNCARYTCE